MERPSPASGYHPISRPPFRSVLPCTATPDMRLELWLAPEARAWQLSATPAESNIGHRPSTRLTQLGHLRRKDAVCFPSEFLSFASLETKIATGSQPEAHIPPLSLAPANAPSLPCREAAIPQPVREQHVGSVVCAQSSYLLYLSPSVPLSPSRHPSSSQSGHESQNVAGQPHHPESQSGESISVRRRLCDSWDALACAHPGALLHWLHE